MGSETPNFGELIEKAQSVGTDVASPFAAPGAGRVAFQGRGAPGVAAHDYEANVSVFVLPADSGEYENVLNMSLRGEAIIRYEEKTFSKEGDFMVAMCWLTPVGRAAGAPAGDAGDRERPAAHERLA